MGSEALDDPAVQKAQQSMTMGFIYVPELSLKGTYL